MRKLLEPLSAQLERLSVPEPNTGCLLWIGFVSQGGYGKLYLAGRAVQAHRAAYELSRGPIPNGLQLDHLCRTRSCINPDHLEAVSQRTNVLRGEGPSATHARKTHCPRGHPLVEGNLCKRLGNPRERRCLTCFRNYQRDFMRAKRNT